MILGAILLLLIGTADILRAATRATLATALSIVVAWAAVVVVAATGLGLHPALLAIPVVLAAVWLATTSSTAATRSAAGVLPAVGVLVALAALLVWDRTAASLAGYIVDWHRGAIPAAIGDIPLTALLVGLGAAVFLVESANLVVRASLQPTRVVPAATPSPRARRSWWARSEPVAPVIEDLRGGRLIGPLERLLIVALTITGGAPIVAGLLAAKGIVRFPEISNDGAGGSKAEYFLVGSLVSWTIAIAATGLLWISLQG